MYITWITYLNSIVCMYFNIIIYNNIKCLFLKDSDEKYLYNVYKISYYYQKRRCKAIMYMADNAMHINIRKKHCCVNSYVLQMLLKNTP